MNEQNCIPAQHISTSGLRLCRRRRIQVVRRLVMMRTRRLQPQERIQVVRRLVMMMTRRLCRRRRIQVVRRTRRTRRL
jgi:hypothetical protein